MGESRPVIRHTRDSRCYVNIPTTLPSSTQPLCCSGSSHESQGNIWFSALEGTLSVWHAVRVWSVSIWTRRPTPAPASLLPLATPPLRLQRLHNAFWQSPLLLALRKDCGYKEEPFAQLWGEKTLQPLLASQWLSSAKSIQICRQRESCLLYCTYGLRLRAQFSPFFHLLFYLTILLLDHIVPWWIAVDRFALMASSFIKPPHKYNQ